MDNRCSRNSYLAIISFMYSRSLEVDIFNAAQTHLNATIGTIHTIILITSDYFVAKTVSAVKVNEHKIANRFLWVSIILGVLFLATKAFEYYHKIELGLTIRTNTFFSYYLFLTAFHYLHVLIGVSILLAIKPSFKTKNNNSENILDVESAAAFWHMCDLIWILIFLVFYLIN